jgi:hypothetical protein
MIKDITEFQPTAISIVTLHFQILCSLAEKYRNPLVAAE